jgi:hypothetical protein
MDENPRENMGNSLDEPSSAGFSPFSQPYQREEEPLLIAGAKSLAVCKN